MMATKPTGKGRGASPERMREITRDRMSNNRAGFPPPTETVPATDGEVDLNRFAASIMNDPKFRKALRRRAQEGKLSATEFAWLRERASLIKPDDTKQEGLRTMISAATEIEVDIMANVFSRALGRPESGLLIPGTAKYLTVEELVQIAQRALGAKGINP